MPQVPGYLNDLGDSLKVGGPIRAIGHLLRRRVEFIINRLDSPVGLRRATHTAALVELVYRCHAVGEPGFFNKDLKARVYLRLVGSGATLKPQEKHFADLDWWERLDKDAAQQEFRSNFERLVSGERTMCTAIGIEMHVLFDMMMHLRFGDGYQSVITRGDRQNQAVDEAFADFGRMLFATAA